MAELAHVAAPSVDDVLGSSTAQRVIAALPAEGLNRAGLVQEITGVTEAPDSRHRIDVLRSAVVRRTGIAAGEFDRIALLLTAHDSFDRLDGMPVPDAVKRRLRSVVDRIAAAPPVTDAPADRFAQFAKIVSLRRWPAGLFDWERSGLPRSWVPRIRPWPSLARTIGAAVSWRGFGPAFFAHLTICRPVRALTPKETLESYRLMAEAMAAQPDIRGMLTASWFHSPDTFRHSPHLSWLNDVFLQHGGIVGTIGPADPDCGVFTRSPERRRAYDEGRFTPTMGLVVWPREEMLAWARTAPTA